ncbi:TIGR02300 family protein [Fodinicurvata fenggangensis]|uniref:TIGR02300 family protein n=1 Tax=Fodinicurvata fenggangensis TaxID=1121830 RepID=UPI00047AD8C9|nr:TIGR02300 family protein [Fodinicurvata fenggangensis]
MAKPEWGTKHQCQSCGTKFYDMLRTPIVCPSCGTEFDPEAHLRGKRGKGASRAKAVEKEAPAAAAEPEAKGDDLELAEDLEIEVEDDALEDASDLGEEEDIAKVGGDDEEEDKT